MLVLGLETSGQPGSVAVANKHGILSHCTYAHPNMHAEHLLNHIEMALASAGCTKQDLGRIAVGTGPGNFTGLRVGIALASGIGLGLRIDVVGVCSLASLASSIPAPGSDVRFVVRDARRDEAFCGIFDIEGDILTPPTLVGTSQLYDWLAARMQLYASEGRRTAIAGDGLQWLSSQQKNSLGAYIPADAELLTPDARQTALIGLRQRTLPAVVADYVRDADAKLPNIPRNAVLDGLARS